MTSVVPGREQYGLRGQVRICVEETTYPGRIAADGTQAPRTKAWSKMEYDMDGRLTSRRVHNPDGSEWVMKYTCDSLGRTLKIESGKEGEPTTETSYSYSYSDNGRPLAIRNSSSPDSPVIFRYDERGRKTKVQTSTPVDYRSNVGVAASPIAAADRPPNLPGGGSATTMYDRHDRPTEVVVRDSEGAVVSRAIGTYDEQGRMLEEHTILDNVETIIPADSRVRILKESGRSLAELHLELTKVMGGKSGPVSIAYTYDEKGRIKQIRRRVFNSEATIETTYNEQGDKSEEITREKQTGEQDGSAASPMPRYSGASYSYEYDDNGNWTRQVITYRTEPTGEFQMSSEFRRSLSYY